ncbi:uncharacterized protein LOC131251834 [Magnolia sinica]|uniref:uncharacterized protein LOC131251834 n=1 Tax=Magnolia sinica TaxID=86752 RepID=UPI00265A6974|nr:uncharacterized protein LOC131251834 [Magnolia sinica]
MKNIKVQDPTESTNDELKQLAPPPLKNRKLLSKQLSIRETSLEAAWEKRRLQILRKDSIELLDESTEADGFRSPRLSGRGLTDEDLNELKGSIDLGFGFNEEDGQGLCDTLPALDLYFAVTRQLSDKKIRYSPSSPMSSTSGSSSTVGSPKSPDESWKICNPGDNPQHVKTRLRHWAQAVACSVRQSC